MYREILRQEFEIDTCFYCGKKLREKIHVDHFIPCSFVKDDKMWNFVLSCSTCNMKKNNQVPQRNMIIKIKNQNRKVQQLNNEIVREDFANYNEGLIEHMWQYAKLSGLKEFQNV